MHWSESLFHTYMLAFVPVDWSVALTSPPTEDIQHLTCMNTPTPVHTHTHSRARTWITLANWSVGVFFLHCPPYPSEIVGQNFSLKAEEDVAAKTSLFLSGSGELNRRRKCFPPIKCHTKFLFSTIESRNGIQKQLLMLRRLSRKNWGEKAGSKKGGA